MSETPEPGSPKPPPPSTDELPAMLVPYFRDAYPSPDQDGEGGGGAAPDGAPADPLAFDWRGREDSARDSQALRYSPLAEPEPDDDEETVESGRRMRGVPVTPAFATPGERHDVPPYGGQYGNSVPPVTVQEASAQGAPSFPDGDGAVKIGLWGSPASGKTTYLAALRHATGSSAAGFGKWNIFPGNTESMDLLVRFTQALVTNHEFPRPTVTGVTVPLQWKFAGDISRTKFDHRLMRRKRLDREFVLDLIDVSGGAFADEPERDKARVAPEVARVALDHLTSARGLIYLFDPIGERESRNSSTYVNRTVAELLRRYAASGWSEQYLPHHVAVCVTKFDHPKVFQQARDLGLVNNGENGLPRVRDEHAEQFFDALCTGSFWSERDEQGQASAQFVREQLSTVFDPKKIRYYVTSSIGFRRPPGWDPAAATRFDPDDFANYVETNGMTGIRGAINPINILEPLIGLAQRIDSRG